jgi:hypothetical protein
MLGVPHGGEVANGAVAHAITETTGIDRELARQELQQRRLAGAGFAHDCQHLAFVQRERDVAAADLTAVALGDVLGRQQRLPGGAHGVAPRSMRKL